jgi:hypothetical protein
MKDALLRLFRDMTMSQAKKNPSPRTYVKNLPSSPLFKNTRRLRTSSTGVRVYQK